VVSLNRVRRGVLRTEDLFALLITAGADVNRMHVNGTLVDTHICGRHALHVSHFLVGCAGLSAFHLACLTNKAAVAAYLLQNGANLVRSLTKALLAATVT
jgi:hypothetical protein